MWANDFTREQATEHLTLFPRLVRAWFCRIRGHPNCECRTLARSREQHAALEVDK